MLLVQLSPYRYYVHVVELTHEETEKYADLTRKIRKLSQCSHDNLNVGSTDSYLDQLIRMRGELIENADGKISVLDKGK